MTPSELRSRAAGLVQKRKLKALAESLVRNRVTVPAPAPVQPTVPPAITITVGTLTIQASTVVLAAETFAPNVEIQPQTINVNVPEQPAPNIVVQPGEVRAIVQLPERKATRVVTIEGPDGEEYTGVVEDEANE